MTNQLTSGHLSKVVPAHRKTMKFNWIHREFQLFGNFKAARTRMGLSIYDKCFWCKKPFADADMMALAQPTTGKNRVLCQGCAEKATVTS
jgi:hypothetical protein